VEHDARAADDDFSTLFNFLPIGAYRSSPQGRQLRANPALVNLNGFSSEAEQLAAVNDIASTWYVDPTRRAAFKQAIEAEGRVVGFESEVYRYKTRERIWISENAHAVRDAAGDVLFYEGTVEEITGRVLERQALRTQGELWKRALDSSGDGVWDWHIASGVETFSRGLLALYGYGAGELGTSPEVLDGMTHPDDVPVMLQARQDHLAGLTPRYVNEHRMRCKDGSWKWILSRGIVIARDALGRPLRMIGTHTDITAAKRADELRHERDRAAAADLAKSQFLSRVSHELRTPLNAILGFSQLLELDQDIGERQQHWVRQVLQSGRHLLGLMDDILDLSSAQTGQLPMNIDTLALRPVVQEVCAMFNLPARESGVSLVDELDRDDGLAVRADRKRLKQVLSNLLSNAIKYNRPGGWVRIGARRDGACVAVTVADNGPGLSTDQTSRLFQPFERLGAQRGTVAGTGLGLALARQLAEAMGGTLTVCSTPGEGAAFELRLPPG
jgi:PAS domain S-box-containing protein